MPGKKSRIIPLSNRATKEKQFSNISLMASNMKPRPITFSLKLPSILNCFSLVYTFLSTEDKILKLHFYVCSYKIP